MELKAYYAEAECLLVHLKYLKTFRTLSIFVSHCEKLNNYKAKKEQRCKNYHSRVKYCYFMLLRICALLVKHTNHHEITLHDTGEKHGIRIKHKHWA